jgi:hypothetical protein
MTIRDMHNGAAVTGVLALGERGRTFRLLCSHLSPAELADVRNALDRRIEGGRIETASWIPGADRRGAAHQPIYKKGPAGTRT